MIVGPDFPPRLADGVELLGEFKDSGYAAPRSLIKRADGQVIQLSRLLYLVARRLDGTRDPLAIADLVSGDLGRPLSPVQVCYLIITKLQPLGILAGHSAGPGAATAPPAATPLLTLKAKGTLLPARAANAAGTLLRPLFHWPVIVAVIAAAAATDYWVFSVHVLAAALGQLENDPVDLLLIGAAILVSAVFHECGHAAGCRYGGARPGRIGVGIYLVWPSFFTNVTDSYRLGRGGRLRTDLGGVYFNLVFILALAGVYAVTATPILLLIIVFAHLQILEQLLPFARFDGYFILSDLVGVPDLFTHVVPVLLSCVPGRRRGPRAAGLDRRAQVVITCWVLCVIPLLVFIMGFLLLHLPAANRALWHSTSRAAGLTASGVAGHRYAAAAVAAISAALAGVSIAGSLYIATWLARRAIAVGLAWSAGHPARRVLVAAAVAGAAVSLAAYWAAQGEFSGW